MAERLSERLKDEYTQRAAAVEHYIEIGEKQTGTIYRGLGFDLTEKEGEKNLVAFLKTVGENGNEFSFSEISSFSESENTARDPFARFDSGDHTSVVITCKNSRNSTTINDLSVSEKDEQESLYSSKQRFRTLSVEHKSKPGGISGAQIITIHLGEV